MRDSGRMEYSAGEIARTIGGTVAGDPEVRVSGVAPFETAGREDLTFAGSPKFLGKMDTCDAGIVIVPNGAKFEGRTTIVANIPYVAFAKAAGIFHPRPVPSPCISGSAVIGDGFVSGEGCCVKDRVVIGNGVTLGSRVTVMPGVVIGDHVSIGDDAILYPNVVIYGRTVIGNRVTIHAGSVIGSDGFGFAPDGHRYYKVPHTGIVQIDDDVEIGANNTIDRGTFGKTWIQEGVKTDNLVHVAHNVTVGAHSLLVAQVGIAGSTRIGDHCVIAGQAGISGHLTIGSRVTVGPKSGVSGDVPDFSVVSGAAEMPHRLWLKVQRILPRLPDMKKRLEQLEKRISGEYPQE